MIKPTEITTNANVSNNTNLVDRKVSIGGGGAKTL